jgi:hypothetical protein
VGGYKKKRGKKRRRECQKHGKPKKSFSVKESGAPFSFFNIFWLLYDGEKGKKKGKKVGKKGDRPFFPSVPVLMEQVKKDKERNRTHGREEERGKKEEKSLYLFDFEVIFSYSIPCILFPIYFISLL